MAKKETPKTGGFPGDKGYVGPPKSELTTEEATVIEEQAELALCNLVAQGLTVSEAKGKLSGK